MQLSWGFPKKSGPITIFSQIMVAEPKAPMFELITLLFNNVILSELLAIPYITGISDNLYIDVSVNFRLIS